MLFVLDSSLALTPHTPPPHFCMIDATTRLAHTGAVAMPATAASGAYPRLCLTDETVEGDVGLLLRKLVVLEGDEARLHPSLKSTIRLSSSLELDEIFALA